jgi:hypothetical protein
MILLYSKTNDFKIMIMIKSRALNKNIMCALRGGGRDVQLPFSGIKYALRHHFHRSADSNGQYYYYYYYDVSFLQLFIWMIRSFRVGPPVATEIY